MKTSRTILLVSVFAVAFALVESSVVVYLRLLYYPEGFAFPLKPALMSHVAVEVSREVATIVMLAVVGLIAGRSRWQRFSYFMIAFGVWDIFYYVWLKIMLNWPASLLDWDVLFLIPVPWIGPVVAPGTRFGGDDCGGMADHYERGTTRKIPRTEICNYSLRRRFASHCCFVPA